MTELQLGNKNVGDGHPAFIIAEIGINHQGDVSIAKNLIQKAKECGADAVKLQKRSISRILTKSGLEMAYDNRNSFGKTYGEHKIALELSEADYHELNTYCKKMDIIFCASGWDEESIDFLDEMGIPFFKMASADLTNFPLLVHTAKKNKPMILSTGMADMKMVQAAYSQVNQINNQIAILQCTSTYPSAFSEVHLNVLQTFMKEFPDTVIGYSGHEQGIAIPPAAVALGAKIIERHFTLDRTMKGGDHAASLEPQGFAKMVRDIRAVEESMGSFKKEIQKSEPPVFKKLAKSIVSAVEIKVGQKITIEMLTTKGPGTGISPTRISELIGKITIKDIPADEVINNEDIQWQS
jgi:sialic acid synthase SpsE